MARGNYQWREEIYIVAVLLFTKNGEAPSKKLATVVAIEKNAKRGEKAGWRQSIYGL